MSEEKQEKEVAAWAELPQENEEVPENKEEIAFHAKRTAALDAALLAIPFWLEQLHVGLCEIRVELKRANDYIATGVMTEIVEAPSVAQPISLPQNLKTEADIETFYKESLKEILGEKAGDVNVAVEENKVILKLPWLGREEWREVNSYLVDQIGGQYVSDGKNTHYVMPHP